VEEEPKENDLVQKTARSIHKITKKKGGGLNEIGHTEEEGRERFLGSIERGKNDG